MRYVLHKNIDVSAAIGLIGYVYRAIPVRHQFTVSLIDKEFCLTNGRNLWTKEYFGEKNFNS